MARHLNEPQYLLKGTAVCFSEPGHYRRQNKGPELNMTHTDKHSHVEYLPGPQLDPEAGPKCWQHSQSSGVG